MRFRLEAEEAEFSEKGPELLKALADRLGVDLSKSLPPKERPLKYPVLQSLQNLESKIYREQMVAMDEEIQSVLDRVHKDTEPTLQKGNSDENFGNVGGTDVERGMLHEQVSTGVVGSSDVVGIDKFDQFSSEVVQKADATKWIADKDEVLYGKVKMRFVQLGYSLSDFDDGGTLYGLSTNQLIVLLEELVE